MLYFFVSLITYFCFLGLKGRKALIGLDKDKYDLKKFKKWLFTKQHFLTLELLGIFLIIISFIYSSKVVGICTIILYMALSLLEIKKDDSKFKLKKQDLKIIIPTLLIYIIAFGLICLDYYNFQKGLILYERVNYYYPIVIILGYILYPIVYLFALITKPNKKKTKKKSKRK